MGRAMAAAARRPRHLGGAGRHRRTAARAEGRQAGARTRLFLDSASAEEWDRHLATGLYFGVTTNPAILERDGVPCTRDAVEGMADELRKKHGRVRELQAQVWGDSVDELVACGEYVHSLTTDALRCVPKVPLTREGVTAAAALADGGVPITLTAAYAPHHALTASALGAEYVAPYLGRMNDNQRNGAASVAEMLRICEAQGGRTRVLVASIRSAAEMAALASVGGDTFTFGPSVAESLLTDPLTLAASSAFAAASARNRA